MWERFDSFTSAQTSGQWRLGAWLAWAALVVVAVVVFQGVSPVELVTSPSTIVEVVRADVAAVQARIGR